MALLPLVLQLVEIKFSNYCTTKIPEEYQNEIKLLYKIHGNSVTLIESRPFYFDPANWSEQKIAQFRYGKDDRDWTLYWADRNERWHIYPKIKSSKSIDDLLNEVDNDPISVFWG